MWKRSSPAATTWSDLWFPPSTRIFWKFPSTVSSPSRIPAWRESPPSEPPRRFLGGSGPSWSRAARSCSTDSSAASRKCSGSAAGPYPNCTVEAQAEPGARGQGEGLHLKESPSPCPESFLRPVHPEDPAGGNPAAARKAPVQLSHRCTRSGEAHGDHPGKKDSVH